MTTQNYIFKALAKLNTIEQVQNIDINSLQIENIVILPFYINTEANNPCLLFGLQNNSTDNQPINFIKGNNSLLYTKIDIETIVDNSNDLFKNILDKTYVNYDASFKGLMFKENTLFIVYQVKILFIHLLTPIKSNIIFALITEILNDKHVEDMEISSIVYNFFSNTLELCLLHDESGKKIYETPSVFYSSCPISKIEFESLFGLQKTLISEYTDNLLYYFGNYNTIVESAIKLRNINNIQYGIIRHLIFLGNNNVILDQDNNRYGKLYIDYYDSTLILNPLNNDTQDNVLLVIQRREQFSTLSYTILK